MRRSRVEHGTFTPTRRGVTHGPPIAPRSSQASTRCRSATSAGAVSCASKARTAGGGGATRSRTLAAHVTCDTCDAPLRCALVNLLDPEALPGRWMIDTRERLARFDGRSVHWVRAYAGERFSVVWYVNKRQHARPQSFDVDLEWVPVADHVPSSEL